MLTGDLIGKTLALIMYTLIMVCRILDGIYLFTDKIRLRLESHKCKSHLIKETHYTNP